MHSLPRGRWGGALLLSAAVLALPLAHARELAPIDALGEAPPALQRKAAQLLPAHVERLTREERLGVPTFVQLRPAAVPQAQAEAKAAMDPASAARAELKALAGLYGLTPQEVDAAPLHHVQTLPGGARLVRLTNQHGGIEVFREQATVLLDAQSRATAVGGYLGSTAPAPTAKAAPPARLDAADAVARALQDWGFDAAVARQLQMAAPPAQGGASPYQWWALPPGVAGAEGATLQQPARAKPVWFRLPQGLVGAYYVEVLVREGGEEHAYAYVVAADDGRLLLRHNQTVHADHSYRVWAEAAPPYTPLHGVQGRNGAPHPTGTPDGYAAPLVAPGLVTPDGMPDPWLASGATHTQGNNVRAFANLQGEGWGPVDANECAGPLAGDFRACVTAPGVFDHVYDAARPPLADRGQAAASVVNLFYTANWLHDWFYEAGFDEAAGNAQADNLGRGGLGGDAMDAQALDFSGTNNANMYTPADGAPPRMRMYRFLNTATQATVSAPSAMAGGYAAAGAAFGPQTFVLTGEVAAAAPANGCAALTNAGTVAGKIALVDRGTCEYAQKVLNAQNAGALGVVVVNNLPGAATSMGAGAYGSAVVIPAIHVTQAAGAAWRAQSGVMLHMQGNATERSSALDNAIIAHEWGHFISNRLIGDASGLTTNHAAGLGEGWGDFHALLMMVSAADINDPANANWTGAYGIGGYATAAVEGPQADAANIALYGLRRYPYSTDPGKNPLTLKHITDGVPLPATAPRNPGAGGVNAEVHNMGEVWAGMLWEFYAALLRAHPFQDAQDRMKRYLVAGYKLTPVNPTLVEARDALLAVARANDPADFVRGFGAFANRGAGAFAQVPDRYSATNAGVVESYAVDGKLAIDGMQMSMASAQAQRCDADDVLDNGETGVLTFTLRNEGGAFVNGAQLALSADVAAVQFPDGATVAVPAIAPGGTAIVTARVKLDGQAAPGGTRITASLTHAGQPMGFSVQQTLDLPLHRDVLPARLASDGAEALPSAMEFGSSVAGHGGAWSVKGYGALDNRYAGSTPEAIGSHWMRTPVLQVAATGDFTVAFRHRYRFEREGSENYDGGQLMISTDGGAWARVDGAGYGGTLTTASGNPAGGQPAYVGQSAAWPAMATASVNLGADYAGHTVRLAWVVHTDPAVGTEGWEVDDIVFTGIANTPFPQVVVDAQPCLGPASLAAHAGTPQSAPVGAAFALPLRVRLLGPGGAPMAGAPIAFAAPGAGASAVLSGASALTDVNGEASVTATANGAIGSYTVTATGGGGAASFALRNTGARVGTGSGGGGGSGALAISGPAPNGLGTVTATVQSVLPTQADFSQSTFANEAGAGAPPMAGYRFPYGLMGFALENVGQGNAATLRIQYPGPVPAGAEYWKYGRTTPAGAPHWHRIPMALIGGAGTGTIEITLTDGGQGDTDAREDGTITDPGGLRVLAAPGPGGAAPVPVLSPFALALLAAGLGLLGWRRRS